MPRRTDAEETAPACSFSTVIHGTYTVNVNGGDFAHLTDMIGTELFTGSMTSFLNIGANVDVNAEVVGTDTFTNPVRPKGPDPWVFYYDGSYYYTHTTGTKIVLMKVQNFSDIDTSAERVIIEPTEGQNMWSPEIHHFSAEEVGEENAGWYPKVVEGASAVYSDNGDVYLMYTGSGYWTIYYQLLEDLKQVLILNKIAVAYNQLNVNVRKIH